MFCRYCGTMMNDSVPICPKCGQYSSGPKKNNSSGKKANAGSGMNKNTSNSGQTNAGHQSNPYGNNFRTNQQFTYQKTWKDIEAADCIVTNDGKRLGIGWLKFFVYVGWIALAVIFLVNAILFFSGNLWGGYKRLVHTFVGSTQMMDVFFGIMNVGLVVGMIVVWLGIINLKKYAIVLLKIVDAANILTIIAFYFYVFNLEVSAPVINHIFNVASFLILTISNNYIHYRRDAFVN